MTTASQTQTTDGLRPGWSNLLVGSGSVLLGVGIGWHATPIALVTSTALLLLGLVRSAWRVEILALASVPLMLWLGLVWPLPALSAGALVVWLRWRRIRHWPVESRRPAASLCAVSTLHPARLTTGLLIGLATVILVLPLAVSRFSGNPLVFSVHRPASWVVVAAVLGAALLNAISEETLWRGVLSCVQVESGQPLSLHVAFQAVSFGLAHFHGIPGGPAGVIGAAGFGAVMALVRLRRGLPAAIAAHVVTDVAIFGAAANAAIFLPNA